MLRPATVVLVGTVVLAGAFVLVWALAAPALAQTPVLQNAIEQRDHWRKSRVGVYVNDFGERGRYRKANAALKPPGPGESRVVFFGDSITDLWRLETAFPGKPYLNRGISGQTTAQMLVRFRQDVVELEPAVAVILAGTNDVAGNTGPTTDDEIEGNLATMAELCRAHGIAVVLASIIPVHNYTPQAQLAFALRPPERIAAINRWLKAAATAGGYVHLDYFGAMVDDKGLLRRELAEDGLHPNAPGYAIMARLAATAIAKALAERRGPAPARTGPPVGR